MKLAIKIGLFCLLLVAPCVHAQGCFTVPCRTGATASASGGGGGIAVTCVTGTGSFSGTSATLTIAAPSGSLVVIGQSTALSANFTSLKDNLGNSLTADTGWIGSTDTGFAAIFHEVSTGITGVTATFVTGSNQIALEGCYVTGLANNALDVADTAGFNNTGGGTWHTGSITTTNAADVVFGAIYDGNNTATFGASSPYVLGDTTTISGTYSASIIYQIVSSTGTYQPIGTETPTNQGGEAIAAAYR